MIPFAGAGCSSASVVSPLQRGVGWRYVAFTGPFPQSDVLGGNPQVIGTTLTSDNDCTAVPVPTSSRLTYIWTYDAPSGVFVGASRAGWPVNPGGNA
jgi:hypothetical protein